jgi:hypothetical protein
MAGGAGVPLPCLDWDLFVGGMVESASSHNILQRSLSITLSKEFCHSIPTAC